MKAILTYAAALALLVSCSTSPQAAVDSRSHQEILFDDGNYALFMHFGLYSHLEAQWQDKIYYGNAEWIMHETQAGIPVKDYMALASSFNPSEFDAEEIVSIAKDAGMKYIVITSKHHEGFAMFDSDVCDFNIKDATPCGRDLIGELADACHRNGLGLGFYYSQYQDWTAPGGNRGPETDDSGRKVSFDEYFRTKCVPQVEELLTKYGEIQLIWFDTPGEMDMKYSQELVNLVHKLQPGALVSSRVGNGLGDYETYGDMELPVQNIPGRWEGIDVMQVGWGFNKYDNEWKTPDYVVRNLMSTIARGGTFMMNVGPTSKGIISKEAAASLRKAGEWVHKYSEVVYGVDASPWGHALPWGDAVVKGDRIYLIVYDWPDDGKLLLPKLTCGVKKAGLFGGKRLKFNSEGDWIEISVPYEKPDELASVIELRVDGEPAAEENYAVVPGHSSEFPVLFAKTSDCNCNKSGYMLRYGEWKTLWTVTDIKPESSVTWTVDIAQSGYYDIELRYSDKWNGDSSNEKYWITQMGIPGTRFAEWTLTSDEGTLLRDMQPAFKEYTWQRMGWIKFNTPGRHTVTLKLIDGDYRDISLASIRMKKVEL